MFRPERDHWVCNFGKIVYHYYTNYFKSTKVLRICCYRAIVYQFQSTPIMKHLPTKNKDILKSFWKSKYLDFDKNHVINQFSGLYKSGCCIYFTFYKSLSNCYCLNMYIFRILNYFYKIFFWTFWSCTYIMFCSSYSKHAKTKA